MNQIVHTSLIGIGSAGIIACFSACTGNIKSGDSGKSRPNIIFILADDLGYGDLGCYGQEKIETPHLDKLAAEGIRFTQFYSGSPVSAPARCILLTGIHSGRAQIRSNDEWAERGDVWDYHAMIADSSLEGQRPLVEGTNTIGRMLQSVGYKTAVVGKWGLGAPNTTGVPNKQGFDLFYGYNCQRQAHTYYPVHLWKNDKKVPLYNDTIAPHTPLAEGADPYDLNNYAPFQLKNYAPAMMMEEISEFIAENRNNPFFLYWATTIPHLPLQAPQQWVDHYVKKFGDEEPYVGRTERGGYFPARYPHATYAAMVSYMDEQVGRLVQQLKDLGLYENTLIIFTSDNGPIGFYAPYFNSAAPFRTETGYMKGNLNEGGIRVPMIASWPGVIKPGTTSGHIAAFQDVLPTLAEIVNTPVSAEISGISFLPALRGKKQQSHEYLYWEFPAYGGQMAVRKGNLKVLRKEMQKGNLKWEVYDLEQDPQERNDISGSHPDLIAEVNEIVQKEHTVTPVEQWRFKVIDKK